MYSVLAIWPLSLIILPFIFIQYHIVTTAIWGQVIPHSKEHNHKTSIVHPKRKRKEKSQRVQAKVKQRWVDSQVTPCFHKDQAMYLEGHTGLTLRCPIQPRRQPNNKARNTRRRIRASKTSHFDGPLLLTSLLTALSLVWHQCFVCSNFQKTKIATGLYTLPTATWHRHGADSGKSKRCMGTLRYSELWQFCRRGKTKAQLSRDRLARLACCEG